MKGLLVAFADRTAIVIQFKAVFAVFTALSHVMTRGWFSALTQIAPVDVTFVSVSARPATLLDWTHVTLTRVTAPSIFHEAVFTK